MANWVCSAPQEKQTNQDRGRGQSLRPQGCPDEIEIENPSRGFKANYLRNKKEAIG